MEKSSCSAEIVAKIEELLTQILVRVPALSLIRFKCVSKQWLSLISDPDFCRRHSLQNPNPKISAFFSPETNQGNPFKTLNNSVPGVHKLRIIQSCNGLLLMLEHRKPREPVYVLNPTTNQFRALFRPSLRNDVTRCTVLRYALAFDPSQSPHYKLVCVTSSGDCIYHYHYDDDDDDDVEDDNGDEDDEDNDDNRGYHKIEIYSSETGEWKYLKTPYFPCPSDGYDFIERAMHFDCRSREGAVYCNGAVHWLRNRSQAGLLFGSFNRNKFSEFKREETDVLHYFEMSQERFLVVSASPSVPSVVRNIPVKGYEPTIWPKLAQRYFGESGGSLYLIETYEHCLTQFDVMEIERDYSGWFVKYQVDLNLLVAAFPGQDCNAFVVLCLSQEKETDNGVEDTSTELLLHLPAGKVISYNLRNKTFKTSVKLANKELALGNHIYLEDVAFPYMETLACL